MSDSICRSVVQPIARRLTDAGLGIGSSITYLSDFSSDADGWNATGTVNITQQTFGGRDNVLKLEWTVTAASRSVSRIMTDVLVNGNTYGVTFSYYIPSTNTSTILREASSCWSTTNGNQYSTTDEWVDVDLGNNVYNSANPWRLYPFNGTVNTVTAGDVFYLHNLRVE
jgi:hypothetical protein